MESFKVLLIQLIEFHNVVSTNGELKVLLIQLIEFHNVVSTNGEL